MGVLLVHGGAGSSEEVGDGLERALDAGLRSLEAGEPALEAAIRSTVVLEDDARFNAGTGSRLTLDGRAEMDAAVMDSTGRCGGVAAITGVKNPVLVAREVLDGPHVLLAGDGAVRFARERGFPEYDPRTEGAQQRLERVKRDLVEGDLPTWMERARSARSGDTVGAVARDDAGRLAAANSTGGVSVQVAGRVGDSALVGAGLFAGPSAAVVSTGIGEEIIPRVVCKEAYNAVRDGMEPQEACQRSVDGMPEEVSFGLLVVGEEAWGAASNRSMAWRVGMG